MTIGIPRETFPGEHRVAVAPIVVPLLRKLGLDVIVEAGAGEAAGFPDRAYVDQEATIGSRADVFRADIIAHVRVAGANPEQGRADLPAYRPGQLVIGFADPLTAGAACAELGARGVSLISMELVPRITRAQNMDALSSMATIAGYKAVLIAASALPRMFPMLNTAAGTVTAARVLVIGAGVAGLQAIASARRLGARVEAYDVRPAVKEQIQSLGARFVELPLDAGQAQDAGGYARAQDETFYARQRELLHKTVAASDVVITTAAVPGKKAPVLVTREMIAAMAPGSVVVDLAAERGGNTEVTRADETVVANGVTVFGPTNITSTVPYHSSQMYSRNVAALLQHLVQREKGADGKATGPARVYLNQADEITREVLVTFDGKIVNARVQPPQEVPA
jgi:H+-translocating NAD(P) transhydrogenase subunit alpha